MAMNGERRSGHSSPLRAFFNQQLDHLHGLLSHRHLHTTMADCDRELVEHFVELANARLRIVDDYGFPDQPMLDEMTDAALQVLSRDRQGFVLMVEAAHIDKQSHLMDADRAVGEVLEFDAAGVLPDAYRALAETQGGRLWLDDGAKGARFVVEFPSIPE